jgi:hypothetical protein
MIVYIPVPIVFFLPHSWSGYSFDTVVQPVGESLTPLLADPLGVWLQALWVWNTMALKYARSR